MTPRPLRSLHLGRIELHPDGQLFFAQNFGGDPQQPLQAVADKRLPELAYQGKLVAQRVGRAHRRRAQKVEQVHRLGVGQRDERPGSKILRHALGYLPVNGLFGQGAVFEQLLEGAESLVAVGGPQQQQFFQGGGAVGRAFGLSCQPLAGSFDAANHA